MPTTTDTAVRAQTPRLAQKLHHDISSPPELVAVRERVRELADRVVAPRAARIASSDERTDGFPRDVFDALAAEGLFRIPFGAADGGEGLRHPAAATAIAVEELAYHSNSVAAIFDVHCILAGNAVNQGTAQQRDRWLRPLIAGDLIGAFATSEPGASSDLSPVAVAVDGLDPSVSVVGAALAREAQRAEGLDGVAGHEIGEIYEGANEVQKWVIARSIFGRDITG